MKSVSVALCAVVVGSVLSAFLIYQDLVTTNVLLAERDGRSGGLERTPRTKVVKPLEAARSETALPSTEHKQTPLPPPFGGSAQPPAESSPPSASPPRPSSKSTDSPATAPEPATPPQARSKADQINDAFDEASRATQSADRLGQELLALSDDEERVWGRRMHEAILREHKVVENQTWNGQILRVAAPLIKLRMRRPIEYKFTVIESDLQDINAFSIAGGYIYLHQALLKWVRSDAELQFVIGHEIAHVDLGHCSAQVTFAARASQVAPDSVAMSVGKLYSLISRAYTKDQEYHADRYALLAMIRSGRTRDEALAFPRRFQTVLRSKGVLDEPTEQDPSVLGTVVYRVNNHFQTHPNYTERIRRLEKLADEATQ